MSKTRQYTVTLPRLTVHDVAEWLLEAAQALRDQGAESPAQEFSKAADGVIKAHEQGYITRHGERPETAKRGVE